MNPKFLKTYEGVVVGSFAGRDDGFPEDKSEVFYSLAELLADGEQLKEKIFELKELSPRRLAALKKELAKKILNAKRIKQRKAKLSQLKRDEALFLKLKNKLNK